MSSQPGFHLNLFNSTLNNVLGDQSNIISTGSQEERREKILRWLDAPDPSSNHKAACLKREPTTGNWFIEGDIFAEWKVSPCQVLWLHGRPGCGKTILSSTVIENVNEHYHANPSSIMAYFYFDFQTRAKQSCQSLLRSLIKQLSIQVAATPHALDQLYSRFESAQCQPDIDDLAMTLKAIVQEPSHAHAFIVVDAVDECTERERLLRLIEDMVEWRLGTLHLLLTSRKEREIEESLTSLVSYQVDIQEQVIAKDIELHVREKLRNDGRLKKWPAKVQEEIKAELANGAHGMFRWVACQLDELRKCAKLSELRKTLRSLPKTLDDTYERILINIDELYREDVHKVLQWLCFSKHPITLHEMVEALAVTFDDKPTFNPDERYADPWDILTRCSSLVLTFATDDGHELRLAHFSVKEYLVSNRIRTGRACIYGVIENRVHVLISQTCLAYLLQFTSLDCLNDSTISDHPLAAYAARYWVYHVRFEEDPRSDKLLGLIMDLFQTSANQRHTPQFITWVRLYDIDDLSNPSSDDLTRVVAIDRVSHNIASPLYYAAFTGMVPVVQVMVEQQVDVNASGGVHDHALVAASSRGYESIVTLLLEHGADANVQGGVFGNALQAASIKGHERVVEVLLEHGADANVQGGDFGNALQAASVRDHQRIVELLLKHGADANVRGGTYGSALTAASIKGHERVVEVLLEHGADANVQGGDFGNALQAASVRDHQRIVELLLKHGADANVRGGTYGSALTAASRRGHERVVEVLLEHGADANAQGGFYGTALQAASNNGNERVVEVLLEHGADANVQGGFYGNALQAASSNGHERIVEVLLKHGADANVQGGYDDTALRVASRRGHEGIVELLLKHGADANAQGGYYGDALQAASINSHERIVELLLKHGADANAQGGPYGTALQAASSNGQERVVELLLEHGAKPLIDVPQ